MKHTVEPKLTRSRRSVIRPFAFLELPSELRNEVYTLLSTDLSRRPLRFLGRNKWPSQYVRMHICKHAVTDFVMPPSPRIEAGLLLACKSIHQEYLTMVARNANITIVVPDLILHAGADLTTAFAPYSQQSYTPPRILSLSTFRPETIRKLKLHLLLPLSIPDETTELYWNTRLIDGSFLAKMTALDSLVVVLTYNANYPDRHSIEDWLSCQAVRLAVASIVENTRSKIYWFYDVIDDKARGLAKDVRGIMRRHKQQGTGNDKIVGKLCNLWMLLDYGMFFRVKRSAQASKQLCALAVEMEQLAIGGYEKGGKHGQ